MSPSDDDDARQDAMLRAFTRLRSEIAGETHSPRSAARQIALVLVERALTSERSVQADEASRAERSVLAHGERSGTRRPSVTLVDPEDGETGPWRSPASAASSTPGVPPARKRARRSS